MYKVHKQDEVRKALENRPENFNKIDDPEAIAQNNKEPDTTLIVNRFGSSRRNSSFSKRNSLIGAGIINNSFISDEDKVIQEAVDILGDLPALHLEHCKF